MVSSVLQGVESVASRGSRARMAVITLSHLWRDVFGYVITLAIPIFRSVCDVIRGITRMKKTDHQMHFFNGGIPQSTTMAAMK